MTKVKPLIKDSPRKGHVLSSSVMQAGLDIHVLLIMNHDHGQKINKKINVNFSGTVMYNIILICNWCR